MNQRTYVMLNPDACERKLIGKIITRIEEKGFAITNMKMMTLNEQILKEHYASIVEKPIFTEILSLMISGPVVAMIVEGDGAVEGMRTLMGSPKWYEAAPGTIRGDYANNSVHNLIHGSETVEDAEIEIKRFFGN